MRSNTEEVKRRLFDEKIRALAALTVEVGKKLVAMGPDLQGQSQFKKADGSLVSAADKLSCDSIRQHLSINFPGELIISEELESSHIPISPRNGAPVWVIDPLDNTKGYLNGRLDYSILLTRLVRGVATHAIVTHPAKDIVTSVARGQGAYCNGSKIVVSKTKTGSAIRQIGVYENGLSTVLDDIPESTEALLAVSSGVIDIALIRICGHKLWDVAFADLLVSEAGGILTDQAGSKLKLDRLEISHEWLIASNGHLHQHAINQVRKKL